MVTVLIMVVSTISLPELVSIGILATCDRSPTVSEVLPVTTDVSEMSADLATFFVRPEG
jgi:hypothetical protein